MTSQGADGTRRVAVQRIPMCTTVLGVAMMACASPPSPAGGESALSAKAGPRVVMLAESESRPIADVDGLRAAGRLRVLVRATGVEPLPRDIGVEDDYRLAEALANELGTELDLVVVPVDVDPAQAIADGRADVATPGCARGFDERAGVVDAVVVGSDAVVAAMRADANPRPRRAKDLARLKTGVRAAGARSVREDGVRGQLGRNATIIAVPSGDAESLLASVSEREVDAVVVFRRELEAYRAYDDSVVEALVLRGKVLLPWLVPSKSPSLRRVVENLAYARALTTHQRLREVGDLDAVRRRGALRVAMLNNAASYFVYRGQQLGFQYELAALLASRLGVRVEIVVPPRPDAMREMLVQGTVDVIPVAAMGDEPTRDLLFSRPITYANQVLVQRKGETPVEAIQDLAGRVVHVRRSSAYVPTLEKLRQEVPTLQVAFVDEDLETEDLIDKVGGGELPLTVANSVLLAAETAYRDDVQGTLVLATERPLVYGLRTDSPKLAARLDALLRRELRGPTYRRIYDRYFIDPVKMRELASGDATRTGIVSPYDQIVRRYGNQYGIDWRLVLAQMYEESRFDPDARSWVGAVGLLQLMPRTAAELGVRHPRNPEQNIHGGVKYLVRQLRRTDPSLPMRQRVRFALAGYNAGMGHVEDARKLARRLRLDPDRWFGNVEKAMLLLEQPRHYQRARFGYCRGREPVAYVSRIQSKYDAYVTFLPGTELVAENEQP